MEEMAGFRMTPDDALEFFTRCQQRGADTTESRLLIMKEMRAELRAIYMTPEDVKRAIKGKKVLHIKAKEDEDA